MKKIFFNILTLLSLFFLMACSEDIPDGNNETGKDNAITLSLFSEPDVAATRSEFFGKASHIDQLIYMIYKWDESAKKYEVDTYFLANDSYQVDAEKTLENCGVVNNRPSPYYLRLIPNPDDKKDQKYKIVCWAQKKDSPFFNLTEFPDKISINYDVLGNNEETLDAFYGVAEFYASSKSVTINLKRPFAQINIGTPGWDYEGFACIQPEPKIVKYSTITISQVAKSFSPFNQKADNSADNLTEITYDWAKLPAYRNLISMDNITGIYATDLASGIYNDNIKEEFLFIDLPEPEKNSESDKDNEDTGEDDKKFEEHPGYDGKFAPYISWKEYDLLCSQNGIDELKDEIFTETFKYLSMCYVLVPFDESESDSASTGYTVKVTFDCSVEPEKAEEEDPGDGEQEGLDSDRETARVYEGVLGKDKKIFEIVHVPVKCNTRTNIVATDGSGFFMNSHELKVKVYTETFADYYKHFFPMDSEWDEDEKKDGFDHGPNGEQDNGDYQWPGGDGEDSDIDPDLGKVRVTLPDLENSNSRLINKNKKTVDVIKYFGDDVKFSIDPLGGLENYSELRNSVTSAMITCEFYLEDEKLEQNSYNKNGNKYDITLPFSRLIELQAANPNAFKTQILNEYEENTYESNKLLKTYKEVPALKYYPFKFKVKTILKDESAIGEKYVLQDFVVTVRLFTSYKFTFSSDSEDLGREIWDGINNHKNKKKDDGKDAYEKQSYYIDNNDFVKSNTGIIEAYSRNGSAGNHKLYALKDNDHGEHLRFRGGAYQTTTSNNVPTYSKGHWIILKNLRENCKITFKMGRDKGVDNSASGSSDYKEGAGNDWCVRVNWGQCDENRTIDKTKEKDQDMVLYWPSYDVNETNINKGLITIENKKTVLGHTETKIVDGGTTNFTKESQDVKLYVTQSGHSYYWILLSEPED